MAGYSTKQKNSLVEQYLNSLLSIRVFTAIGAKKKVQCPIRSGREVMTDFDNRQYIVGCINEAVANGASKHKSWKTVELNIRTYQRWFDGVNIRDDKRPKIERPEPSNKLSESERKAGIDCCNNPKYASLPPSQIVPRLADRGGNTLLLNQAFLAFLSKKVS